MEENQLDEEPAESLWAKMGGQTNIGNIMVVVCYRLSDQEEIHEASSDNWKKSQVHRLWPS